MKYENWEELANEIRSANPFYSHGADEWAVDTMIAEEQVQREIYELTERFRQLDPNIQVTQGQPPLPSWFRQVE